MCFWWRGVSFGGGAVKQSNMVLRLTPERQPTMEDAGHFSSQLDFSANVVIAVLLLRQVSSQFHMSNKNLGALISRAPAVPSSSCQHIQQTVSDVLEGIGSCHWPRQGICEARRLAVGSASVRDRILDRLHNQASQPRFGLLEGIEQARGVHRTAEEHCSVSAG